MDELVAIETIGRREKLKTVVLDSVSSPITKYVYSMARRWAGLHKKPP
jgi:hypothetical protein